MFDLDSIADLPIVRTDLVLQSLNVPIAIATLDIIP